MKEIFNWFNITNFSDTNCCLSSGVVCRNGYVTKLDFTRQEISGSIPTQLRNLKHLEELYLSGNHFSGEIPALDNPSLSILSLEYNQLSGNIPDSLSKTNLSALYLGFNQLTGEIPSSLGRLNIRKFSIQNNSISGTIPQEIASWELSSVFIHNNNLSGKIPWTNRLDEHIACSLLPNTDLCLEKGTVLPKGCPEIPKCLLATKEKGIYLSNGIIAGIAVFVILVFVLEYAFCKLKSDKQQKPAEVEAGENKEAIEI